jgi:mono/diheme cytochrome c family protein
MLERRGTRGVLGVAGVLAVLAGCRADGEAPEGPAAAAHREAVEESGPPPGALPEGITAEQAEEGRRTYRLLCVTCHGGDGEGTQLGPSLVDGEWRLAEGGAFPAVVEVVRAGVDPPEEYPVPMPGAEELQLSEEEVRAVAAYAYSLGRRE